MSRYIDADKAIEAVRGAFEFEVETPDNYKDIAVETLKLLTAVDVAPQWIPVTERLPKLNTDVLLSVRQGYAFGEPDNWCVVGGLIDKEDITWATRYGFHDPLYSNGKHTVWVSAWMPLPEPYKGSEQNE